MTTPPPIKDANKELQTDLLKSFHEQFATNQNHHQTIFIQFISAVLVVIIGYGIIYSHTTSLAKPFDLTKDEKGNIESYSILHLIGTYIITQFVMVLLGSLIMNIGYSIRRDQKVVYNIRRHYLGEDLYKETFGEKSFNPMNKGLIYNSFLPGFNLIFVIFVYFMQVVLLVSIIIALRSFQFTFKLWIEAGIYVLVCLPLIFSIKYLYHYYKKYQKAV